MKVFSQTKQAFGLDIGSSSFKILQFEGTDRSRQVKAFAEVNLPKGVITNDAIFDQKTFIHLMEIARAKPQFGKITTPYAVVSLPESKSFVRVIEIPKMSEADAETAVPYEAESFVPLPIDQVYLDWQILGMAGEKMQVLMIASPKEFVDAYLSVLDKIGIKTVALEVESQSCHRALINPANKETVLITDIATSRSSLIMVEEGNLQFTSTIPLASSSFTEGIARSLGVSAGKAEAIKQAVGINNTPEYPNIKTALVPVLAGLAAEIKNVLRFNSEHSGKPVTKIILTGGGARLKNLAEYLQGELSEQGEMRVEIANPWQNIKGLKVMPMNPVDSLGLSTAVGLAMRGINFEG